MNDLICEIFVDIFLLIARSKLAEWQKHLEIFAAPVLLDIGAC